MGWCSGSEIAKVFEKIILKLPKKERIKAVKSAYDQLTEMDWDCVNDVPMFWHYELETPRGEDEINYCLNELDKAEVEEFKKAHKEWCKKLGIKSTIAFKETIGSESHCPKSVLDMELPCISQYD